MANAPAAGCPGVPAAIGAYNTRVLDTWGTAEFADLMDNRWRIDIDEDLVPEAASMLEVTDASFSKYKALSAG